MLMFAFLTLEIPFDYFLTSNILGLVIKGFSFISNYWKKYLL